MIQPPGLAQKLLRWYVGAADVEDIQGDLDEVYYDQVDLHGKLKADIKYWIQICSLLFSYGIQSRKSKATYSSYYFSNPFAMFKNYFKIAIRNFSKHKLFTILNIGGLALGMCICLLALSIGVAIYRSDEHHQHKDRIFQINTHIADTNGKTYGSTFHAVGEQLETNYPFVEEVLEIQSGFRTSVDHHGNDIDIQGYYADGGFFNLFDFKLISGDPKTALERPYSLILTQQMADKFYRHEDPIGKILETEHGAFTVTGVIEDLKQTHLFFEVLTSYETFNELSSNQLTNDWVAYRNHYVYALLREGTEDWELDQALADISETAATFNVNKTITLESIGLTAVVPRWNISNALGIGWDQPTMIFFLAIGLLVLLPAVFNYTNLSIARALKRAKEIGIRKVVGAEKNQIKAQFIIETIILSLLALLGSFALLIPLKREFLEMVYAAQVLDTSADFYQVTTFVVFAVIVGLLAGIFPAQYFSRMNPIQTIKGEVKDGKSQVNGLKKGLFVFQFFLSLVFIIGVAAIGRQYSYVLNENHGFDSDNVLVIPFNGIDKQIALSEWSKHPAVRNITASSNLPGVLVHNTKEATSNEIDTLEVKEVFCRGGLPSKYGYEINLGKCFQPS